MLQMRWLLDLYILVRTNADSSRSPAYVPFCFDLVLPLRTHQVILLSFSSGASLRPPFRCHSTALHIFYILRTSRGALLTCRCELPLSPFLRASAVYER